MTTQENTNQTSLKALEDLRPSPEGKKNSTWAVMVNGVQIGRIRTRITESWNKEGKGAVKTKTTLRGRKVEWEWTTGPWGQNAKTADFAASRPQAAQRVFEALTS